MRSKQELNLKINELTRVVKNYQKRWKSEEERFALKLALKIVRGSQVVIRLKDSGDYNEAFTILRLTLEDLFNFGALFYNAKHYDNLLNHSLGEPSRQISKINDGEKDNPVLSPSNSKRVAEFLGNPERRNDPKNGLKYLQIAESCNLDCLYVNYKKYSFLYAHSTYCSICFPPSVKELSDLSEEIWTVLEFVNRIFKEKNVVPRESRENELQS